MVHHLAYCALLVPITTTRLAHNSTLLLLMVVQGESAGEYILILCNAIGSPVDSKYVAVEPRHLALTHTHVIAASEEGVYVWQFRTAFTKLLSTDVGGVKRRDVREKAFHIDNPNPAMVGEVW